MPSGGEQSGAGPVENELRAGESTDAHGLESTAERAAAVIRDGLERFGEPFVAFLTVDGVDSSDPSLLEDFTASYIGHFPDRFSFTLDRLDYPCEGSIALFLERLGLPDEAAGWSHEQLWQHFYEVYRITERLGGIYVFER